MERTEFEAWMDANDDWDYTEATDGLIVIWRQDAMSRVTYKAIADNTLDTLTAACVQGRDVDHITRVTGYFSRTSQWNKGKTAELKDRHRVEVG